MAAAGSNGTVIAMGRFCTLAAGAVAVLFGLTGCGAGPDRQEQVREAAATVMPFDLDKTKHSFVKTDDGGVQTVVSLDVNDVEQVALVRGHLLEIREAFSAGRFDDPITIHGADMPGVAELAAGADRLEITYRAIDGGAELTYRSTDGPLVAALHDWFDAQISDHGADAVSAPFGHVMSEEMWRNHHPGQPYPGDTTDGK